MERIKRLVVRAFVLPAWLALAIAVPAFGLLIWVFAAGMENTPWAFVSYALSAYALAVLCVLAPGFCRSARTGFADHPMVCRARSSQMGARLLQDSMYRAEVALYAGLAVNLLYAAVKMISGIVFRSIWFGALAGYYLLLSLMRYMLLQHARSQPVGRDLNSEWRRYRLCGSVLLVMNQALAVVVFLVVRRNSGFEYPGLLIYAMAVYTFYAVVNAVRNIMRFRQQGSPVMLAAKAVSFVAALVSLLSLETAMLTQFGKAEEARFRQIMTGTTGWVVCAIVLGMAVYMIVRSTKQIRLLEKEMAAHG